MSKGKKLLSLSLTKREPLQPTGVCADRCVCVDMSVLCKPGGKGQRRKTNRFLYFKREKKMYLCYLGRPGSLLL